MISSKLRLRYGVHPHRPTTAWFIPGNDVARWIDVMVEEGVSQKAVRFLPVPGQGPRSQLAGALMLAGIELPIKPPLGSMSFGTLAGRLYLPVEADLVPGVTDAELAELLPLDSVCVWLPVVGLVACENTQLLRAADLLKVGAATDASWDQSRTGVVLSGRLSALSAESRLDIESVIDAGRDDIGTRSELDGWTRLPPLPREPGTGMFSSVFRQVRKLGAGAILGLLKMIPRPKADRPPATGAARATPSKPGWIDRLKGWATEQVARINEQIEAARSREVNRLMEMLEKNPDEGLKYALPMTGDPHRGRAPANTNLVRRNTSFDMNRMGGQGAADIWDVSTEKQLALIRRYRELANREINLGRHRRAAYIFAELLGDFQGATGALAAGKHFREAAAICQKRLNSPLRAAEYLEQGGFWTEAIEILVELNQHEKAGDLYRRIGQEEDAVRQFRSAVGFLRDRMDHLAAAKILEEKLHSTREAIGELAAGWPNSSQSILCLKGEFEILGRSGLHDEAKDRVRGFQNRQSPGSDHPKLVEVLVHAATRYPDLAVRHRAADCVRVVSARGLKNANTARAAELLGHVAQLDSPDRLLGNDCHRFGQLIRERQAKKVALSRLTGQIQAVNRRTLKASGQIEMFSIDALCKSAITCGDQIFVAGIRGDELLLGRSSWEKAERSAKSWKIGPGKEESEVILAANALNDRHVYVHVPGTTLPESQQKFSKTDECSSEITVGNIAGAGDYCLGAVRGANGNTFTIEIRSGEVIAAAIAPDGMNLWTIDLPFGPDVAQLPVPMVIQRDRVLVCLRNSLVYFERNNPHVVAEAATPIRSIASSLDHSQQRLLLGCEQGVEFVFRGVDGYEMTGFANDMQNAVVGISGRGYLIVADDQRCEVYRTVDRKPVYYCEFPLTQRPLAVLVSPQSNQFGLAFPNGPIMVLDIPQL